MNTDSVAAERSRSPIVVIRHPKIEVYIKDWCGYSMGAKALLESKSVSYEEIDVTSDPVREAEMIARAGRHTVPQVFIDGRHIGGFDELAHLDSQGELDLLLFAS